MADPKQRTVYVNKPVFMKPDPLDPVKYVYRSDGAQELEPVDQASVMPEEPAKFEKLKSALQNSMTPQDKLSMDSKEDPYENLPKKYEEMSKNNPEAFRAKLLNMGIDPDNIAYEDKVQLHNLGGL